MIPICLFELIFAGLLLWHPLNNFPLPVKIIMSIFFILDSFGFIPIPFFIRLGIIDENGNIEFMGDTKENDDDDDEN